jgi:hypothetical protein
MISVSQLERIKLAPRSIPYDEYDTLPKRFNPQQFVTSSPWIIMKGALGKGFIIIWCCWHCGLSVHAYRQLAHQKDFSCDLGTDTPPDPALAGETQRLLSSVWNQV